MTLDLTEQERSYLLALLETKLSEMFHELHHTDTLDYKEGVKQRIELVETLRSKLEAFGG